MIEGYIGHIGLYRAYKVLRFMYSDGLLYREYRVLRFMYSGGGYIYI